MDPSAVLDDSTEYNTGKYAHMFLDTKFETMTQMTLTLTTRS